MTRALSSPQGSDFKHAHIAGVDGLRAVAVLAVVLFHLSSTWLPGGFAGVDVFFVISGYVVTASLARSRATSLSAFITGFYARRLLRIYPALLACLLTVAIAHTLFVPSSEASSTGAKTGMAALLGLSNFALIRLDDGYFSASVEFNAFTHTWSLAVEEQFYLVFPLLLWVLLKRVRSHGVSPLARGWAFACLPLLIFASLIWSAYETQAAPSRAYYLLPSRFWELGAGALISLLQRRGHLLPSNVISADVLTTLGLILIATGMFFSQPDAFPYPWALLSVAGTALAIIGVSGTRSRASAVLLENAAAQYVGRLSYSLYLWHWPVIVLMRWTCGMETAIDLLVAALLMTLAAVASYHFLEAPLRSHPTLLRQKPLKIVVGSLLIILLTGATSAVIYKSRPVLSLSKTTDLENWSPESKWTNAPPATGTRQIFVQGDSHAWAYSNMLQMLKEKDGWTAHRYYNYGCSTAALRTPATPACAAKVEHQIKEIERISRPGDVVLLGALRTPPLGTDWESADAQTVLAEQGARESAQKRSDALAQADALVSRLLARGLVVILDAPKPVLPAPAYRCTDWFNRDNPICSPGMTIDRDFLLQLRQPVMKSIETLQAKHPTLIVWDSFFTLCPKQRCSAFDGDRPFFFDGHHLSGHANVVLYPEFRQLITQHRGEPASSAR